jgi:PD-(D/E)XK endonuclease
VFRVHGAGGSNPSTPTSSKVLKTMNSLLAQIPAAMRGQMFVNIGLQTEAKVLSLLAEQGVSVLLPFGQHPDYDLVFQLFKGGKFYSVQCKAGMSEENGRFIFHATDNRGRRYAGRVDFIAAYDRLSERLFLVPPEDIGTNGHLRLKPIKSKQRKKIRFADDYDFMKVLSELGWASQFDQSQSINTGD